LGTEATDTLDGLRERVSQVDREIVDAINRRIELVHLVWAHKREHGLEEIYAAILDLTKREVGRD
jgi:chorismate mutase